MEDYSVLEAADAAQCRYMLSNNDVDLVISGFIYKSKADENTSS